MILDAPFLSRLTASRTTRELVCALQIYYRDAESAADTHLSPNLPALACRSGCAFCCYIPVAARPAEIFLLAGFIQTQFNEAEQVGLIQRLREHVTRSAPLTREQRHATNTPCPLLRDSRCSAYAARPLACRAHHCWRLFRERSLGAQY